MSVEIRDGASEDEARWLAALRARRAAGAYAVATLEDVERLIAERDEARRDAVLYQAERDRWASACEAVATALGYRPGEWTSTSLGREVAELRDMLASARRERDEARLEIETLRGALATTLRDRDEARIALSVRMALRVEIEEILGVTPGPASDEQLRAGVEAARKLRDERDAARAATHEAEERGMVRGLHHGQRGIWSAAYESAEAHAARICAEARAKGGV